MDNMGNWSSRRLRIAWIKRHRIPAKFKPMSWPQRDQLLAQVAIRMQSEGFYSPHSRPEDIARGLNRLIKEAEIT